MNTDKIQKFAGDVVYDLRQRGLLPVVALLGVGVILVPFVISRGGGESSPPAPPPPLPGTAEASGFGEPAVLTYNPGLRNYTERLDALKEKDPFEQQFSGAGAAAQLQQPALAAPTGGADAGAVSGDATVTAPTGGTGDGSSSPSSSAATGDTQYFIFQVDMQLASSDGLSKRRNDVKPLSVLPSKDVPVFVFLGGAIDGKHALFIPSNEATPVEGEQYCSPSPTSCDLVSLKEGQKVIFAHSDGKVYSVKILSIDPEAIKQLPGEGKSGKKSSSGK